MPGASREEFGGEVETPKCERATKWLEYLNMKERERKLSFRLNTLSSHCQTAYPFIVFNFYTRAISTRDAKFLDLIDTIIDDIFQ